MFAELNGATALGITTLSITTLIIMRLSIKIFSMHNNKLSSTQHNGRVLLC
jgi:hypothetical protein